MIGLTELLAIRTVDAYDKRLRVDRNGKDRTRKYGQMQSRNRHTTRNRFFVTATCRFQSCPCSAWLAVESAELFCLRVDRVVLLTKMKILK